MHGNSIVGSNSSNYRECKVLGLNQKRNKGSKYTSSMSFMKQQKKKTIQKIGRKKRKQKKKNTRDLEKYTRINIPKCWFFEMINKNDKCN